MSLHKLALLYADRPTHDRPTDCYIPSRKTQTKTHVFQCLIIIQDRNKQLVFDKRSH